MFANNTWGKTTGKSAPGIDYFKPGRLLMHPAIVNHWQRKGGVPEKIPIEATNVHPDNSIILYLKTLMEG